SKPSGTPEPGCVAPAEISLEVRSDDPRGILNQGEGQKYFHLARFFPSGDLAFFIEHYWIVRWDLPGKKTFRQDILTHPAVHIGLEPDRSEVYGVVEGRFIRDFAGRGRVFGIRFQPGGFHPFFRRPLSELTNHVAPIGNIFG